MQTDADNRLVGFEEKPANPKTMPGDDKTCLASMGVYVFNAHFLFDQLCQDATLQDSAHDFGRNIIPSIIKSHRLMAYPFIDENSKADCYWRDVGTLDAYYQSNLELTDVEPLLNLYDYHWPVRTDQPNLPPPKFVFDEDSGRRGLALDTIVAAGTIISGGKVRRSVLGPMVRVEERAEVSGSILFKGVRVGKGAVVRNAIIDKHVVIPDGAQIGVDLERDLRRGFTITEGGIVVVPVIEAAEEIFARP
jgi:glucose-1-phosphate adenylyltransferase